MTANERENANKPRRTLGESLWHSVAIRVSDKKRSPDSERIGKPPVRTAHCSAVEIESNGVRACRTNSDARDKCPLPFVEMSPVETTTFKLVLGLLAVGLFAPSSFGVAQTPDGYSSPERLNAAIDESVNKAIAFLKNRGQGDDGMFSPESGIAVTGLCVRAILDHRPGEAESPWLKKALESILANVRSDGGVYSKGSLYRNYETSVAVSALTAANKDNRYESQLKRAEAFLKEIQWDEGEGVESSDAPYGGAGYGKHGRPDLSNTSFMVDALHDLGNGADDEAIQKALKFVSRTQNLAGHGNDTSSRKQVGRRRFLLHARRWRGESKVVVPEDPEE